MIVRTAETMPEDRYEARAGSVPGVRTFGQQLIHVAVYNFLWCSQAKGEPNPSPQNMDRFTSKAEIIKTLNNAFSYCDSAYNSVTDASGSQMIYYTEENGHQAVVPRVGLLVLNYGHNRENYGSLVTYLRMNDIVPPAF
jgi:hypothetical protein